MCTTDTMMMMVLMMIMRRIDIDHDHDTDVYTNANGLFAFLLFARIIQILEHLFTQCNDKATGTSARSDCTH